MAIERDTTAFLILQYFSLLSNISILFKLAVIRSYPVTNINSFRLLTICIFTSLLSHWLINSIAIGYSLFAVTSSPHTLHSTPSSFDSASFTLLFASLARFFIAGIITDDIFSTDILFIQIHIDLRVCDLTSDSESVISLHKLGNNLVSVSSFANAS